MCTSLVMAHLSLAVQGPIFAFLLATIRSPREKSSATRHSILPHPNILFIARDMIGVGINHHNLTLALGS